MGIYNLIEDKSCLRFLLSQLSERDGLDELLEAHLKDNLNKKVILRPSIGPSGEGGKDIVFLDNDEPSDYCSIVLKRGRLSANLDGKYGIIKQVEDAMHIELPIRKYKDLKRTVLVVHNGYEGNRGAIGKYENEMARIEEKYKDILSSPIKRWDLDELTNSIFPYGENFLNSEKNRRIIERIFKLAGSSINLYDKLSAYSVTDGEVPPEVVDILKDFQFEVSEIESDFQKVKNKDIPSIEGETESE